MNCLKDWQNDSIEHNNNLGMNSILTWATIASPIVGVIAIILASISSSRSLKRMNQQIESVNNLLNVFVAAENPAIMEAKRKYEQDLAVLDRQIQELDEDIKTINNPFLGRGPMVEVADELYKKNEQCKQLELLEKQTKREGRAIESNFIIY